MEAAAAGEKRSEAVLVIGRTSMADLVVFAYPRRYLVSGTLQRHSSDISIVA